MTDERSGGDPPPMPGPPPLAPEPPLVVPPPPHQPPAGPRPTGFWIAMVGLGFVAGVGVTLLFLWLTSPIAGWRAQATRGGVGNTAGTSNLNLSAPAVTPQVPSPPPAQTGTAPSAASLEGTWGPDCPGARTRSVTFHGDGTMEAEGGTGSWSVNGYEVTLTGERDTTMVRWEMLGNDSARVSRPGGASRIVNRCN